MADREFKIRLSANIDDVINDFKVGSKELKKFAEGVAQAENKLEALQEAGAYLAQMDKALSQLSTKYPDVFSKVFGKVNAQIKKSLEPIAKSGAIIQKIGAQLEGISTGKLEATNTEMKQLGETVQVLAKAMNVDINLDFLDGSGKAKTKAKQLIDVMAELTKSYSGVSAASSKSKTKKKEMPYEEFSKTIEAIKLLSKKVDDGDDSAFDAMDKKISKLVKSFALSEDGIAQLEVVLQSLDDSLETTMAKLQTLLGEQFPTNQFDNLSTSAEDAKTNIDSLTSSIINAFNAADKLQRAGGQGNETMNLVGSKGVVSSANGQDLTIDADTMVNQLLANLKESIVMSLHDHPNASDAFTPDDIKSYAELYYGQGTKLHGIIANGLIKTIDFNGISQELAIKIAESYSKNISEALMKSKLFDFKDGDIIPTDAFNKLDVGSQDEAREALILELNDALDKAFVDNGLESTVREWYESEIPELSQYLQQLGASAQETISPLEKLKNLFATLNPGGQTDWNNFAAILDQFSSGAIDASTALEMMLNKTKELKQVGTEVPDNAGVDPAKVNEGTAAIEGQTEALRERNRVEQEDYDDEDYDDIQRENGALEEKLALLRDIAEQHGSNITQRDRNTYAKLEDKDATEEGLTPKEEERFYELQEKIESADESLEEFGATYDKIILKLENGKSIEILPNDKGLRDLLKFADEGMGEYYNGIQVEDVIFQRAKATEAAVVKEITSYEELCQVVERYNQLVAKGSDRSADENKELDSILARYKATKGEPTSLEEGLKNLEHFNAIQGLGGLLDENKLAQYLGIEIPVAANKTEAAMERATDAAAKVDAQMDKAGASVEDLNAKAEEAKATFNALTQQISSGTMRGELTDIDIGKYTVQLDAARNKLQELAAQEVIAADEMQRFEAAYAEANEELRRSAELNSSLRAESSTPIDYGDYEDPGSYDRGFDDGYSAGYNNANDDNRALEERVEQLTSELAEERARREDVDSDSLRYEEAANRLLEEKMSLQNEIETLKSQLSSSQQGSGADTDMSAEVQNLEQLRAKLDEVQAAIESKTAAFTTEGQTVNNTVAQEIADLERLQTKLTEIANTVANIGKINLGAKNNIKDNQKEPEKKESESKQKQPKDTFTADKDKALKSLDAYRNSLNKKFIPDDAMAKLSELEGKLQNLTNAEELKAWAQEWNAITSEISQASKEAESFAKNSQNRTLKGLSNSLEKSYKAAKIDPLSANEDDKAILKEYSDLMAELDTYSQKGSSVVDDVKLKSLEERAAKLKEIIELRILENEVEAKWIAQKETEEKANKRLQDSEENKMLNLFGAAKNAGISETSIGKNAIDEVTNAWRAYANAKEEADKKPDDASAVENAKELKAAYDQAVASLKELITEKNKLSKNSLWKVDGNFDVANEANRKSILKSTVEAQHAGKNKIRNLRFSSDGFSLSYEAQNADKTWSQLNATMDKAGSVIASTNKQARQLDGTFKSLISGSLSKMKSALQVFSGYDLFFRGIEEIRRGVQYITEIDTALTELKKVTDETDATYNQFLQTMSKTGAEIGATVANLTTMAADWARLGYNIEEAGALAESTAILLNVSEFTSAEDASAALISTMQAFGYAAEDSMHVVDVLNEIGNNFAISSDGIAVALQDSASSLMAAGNTMEQSVAMIAAANKVLQDPNTVGRFCRH